MPANTPGGFLPLGKWLHGRPAGHAVACAPGGVVLTQADLQRAVAAFTRVPPGTRCALAFEDGFLFTAALLASLCCGAVPVLLNTHQASAVLRSSDRYDVLFTDFAELSALESAPGGRAVFHAAGYGSLPAGGGRPDISPCGGFDPGEGSLILQTSGSTGPGREVRKTVRELDEEARLTCRLFAGRLAGHTLCASVYPSHQYGLTFRIFMPMCAGIRFFSPMIRYSEHLCDLGAGEGPYAFISSPAFLRRLDTGLVPPDIGFILSAGGRLEHGTAAGLKSWCGIFPDEIYGSTETGVVASRRNDREGALWELPQGTAVEERDGSFIFRAPHAPGGTVCGTALDDVLLMHGERRFELLGRRDRVVKIEDRRVSLSEVRSRILGLPGVADCEVVPLERGRRACLGAAVVLEPALRARIGGSADNCAARGERRRLEQEMRSRLSAMLDAACVPRVFVFPEAIPVNEMGKRLLADIRGLF